MSRLVESRAPFDVFFVGLDCPLTGLEVRERQRGDRGPGEARQDFDVVHTFGTYDLEIDATRHVADNVAAVLAAWRTQTRPSVFSRYPAPMIANPPVRAAVRVRPGSRVRRR